MNNEKLSKDIKIDLHIHSCASGYKDGAIVENSTIENIDVLVDKLKAFDISLCAITDHNRFNYNLYIALKERLAAEGDKTRCNLPGVEFDVVLEENHPKCHIVAIFDDSNADKVSKIEEKIFDIKELTEPDAAYTLEDFEKILRNIGLRVILIVHQRQGLNNQSGHSSSLSGASSDPYRFMRVGFVDCLEYNYPRVEGIVKSSLRDVGLSYPIITGSDCHEWASYPYHDSGAEKVTRDFTGLRCLPTFKGLLMSITAFETRANKYRNSNEHYIKEISIGGVNCPLSNGVNVIIGDNGSGKTLLADVINNNPRSYYKNLIKKNEISVSYTKTSSRMPKIEYVAQGQIAKQVRDGDLFNNHNYFNDITTKDEFANGIKKYFEEIYGYVKREIGKQELFDSIAHLNWSVVPVDRDFYYPVLKTEIELEDAPGDEARLNELEKIVKLLKAEVEDSSEYYIARGLDKSLKGILDETEKICDTIRVLYETKKLNNTVRGIIKNRLQDWSSKLCTSRSSHESRMTELIKERDEIKHGILEYIKAQYAKNTYPTFPQKLDGVAINERDGYRFCKTAPYHQRDLENEFYTYCFNKGYQDRQAVSKIKTQEEFSAALSYHDLVGLDDFKKVRLAKFIEIYSKETTSISEISSSTSIGNTPGEVSLVYYKFIIQESDDEYDVLLIDQPEDDINPNRIRACLNDYINSIRYTKQVILITHSPLLVVNLDVDNVVYLIKKNNEIHVSSGSLEYECGEYAILDLVRDNLDGGYDAIERRLKAYEKDNY